MTDAAPPAETPAEDQAQASPEAPKAPRKPPRKLRPLALIILPLLPLLALAAVWLFGDGILQARIRGAIQARQLDPGQTQIQTDVLGGMVALDQAELVASHEGETRTVYRSPRTVIDIAMLDSALSGSAIIDELTVRDALIDLSRFSDGSVPGLPEDEAEDPEAPSEAPPRDLVELYRRLREWYDRAKDWMPEGEEGGEPEAGEDQQPVRPASGWERAVRYFPKPTPEQPTPGPRALIRKLELGGQGLVLPDSQASRPSPLDLTGFHIDGQQVTTRLEAGETMQLGGEYTTQAAGAGSFTYRADLAAGGLTWAWNGIPLATVADPAVSGERLQRFGPSGDATMSADLQWQGEALSGTVVIDLVDLRLQPAAEAGAEVSELARAIDELRSLHAKLSPETPFVIRWPLTVGGSTSEPRIVDLGVASLQAAIADAARQLQQAATAKVKAVADEAKQAAVEEGKALIQDVTSGKDAEASAQERLKNLETKGDGLKSLLPGKK